MWRRVGKRGGGGREAWGGRGKGVVGGWRRDDGCFVCICCSAPTATAEPRCSVHSHQKEGERGGARAPQTSRQSRARRLPGAPPRPPPPRRPAAPASPPQRRAPCLGRRATRPRGCFAWRASAPRLPLAVATSRCPPQPRTPESACCCRPRRDRMSGGPRLASCTSCRATAQIRRRSRRARWTPATETLSSCSPSPREKLEASTEIRPGFCNTSRAIKRAAS